MDTASYLRNQKSKHKQPWTRGLWGILAAWIHILEMVVNMSSTVIGQILHSCLDICKNERSQTNAIHLCCRYSKTSEFGNYAINANSQLSQRSNSNNRLDWSNRDNLPIFFLISKIYVQQEPRILSTIYRIFRLILSEEERASPTRGWYKSREMWTQTNAYVAWPKTVCYRTRSYITPVIPALVHHRSRHVPTPGIWIPKEKNLDDSD